MTQNNMVNILSDSIFSRPASTQLLSPVWQRLVNNPADGTALQAIGLGFFEQEQYRLAAAYLEAAAVLRPSAQTHILCGKAWLALKEYLRAESSFTEALSYDPDSVEALAGAGNSFYGRKQWGRAEHYYEKLQQLLPDNGSVILSLSHTSHRQLRLLESAEYLLRLIELEADNIHHYTELAWRCFEMGDREKADSLFLQAIEKFGPVPDVLYPYGFFLLHVGMWKEGLELYEERWETSFLGPRYHSTIDPLQGPRWDGKASLEGKLVMVLSEQGAGDLIQFAQYCPRLLELGATLDILSTPSLEPVLRSLPWIRQVHTEYRAIPPFDYYVPLMSCPLYFQTRPETLPQVKPYLAAPYQRERFSERPTIGLAWFGDPKFQYDHYRSFHSFPFGKLIEQFPEYRFVSLQFGTLPADAQEWVDSGRLIDGAAATRDYGDTAASLMAVDLLICSDSSITHLAGAMGVPTFLLLNACADWRWLGEGMDTPWYANHRLYRQKELGDWAKAFQRMAADLPRQLAGVR